MQLFCSPRNYFLIIFEVINNIQAAPGDFSAEEGQCVIRVEEMGGKHEGAKEEPYPISAME